MHPPLHLIDLFVSDLRFLACFDLPQSGTLERPELTLLSLVCKDKRLDFVEAIWGGFDVPNDDLGFAAAAYAGTYYGFFRVLRDIDASFGLHHGDHGPGLVQIHRIVMLQQRVIEWGPRGFVPGQGQLLLVLDSCLAAELWVTLLKGACALLADLLLQAAHMLAEVIEHDVGEPRLP